MPTAGQPAAPSLSLDTGDSTTAMATRHRGPSPLEAFFWLFDIRFERYLTPWIIRVSWILFLIFAALALVGWTLSAVGGGLGDASPDMLARPGRPSSPTKPIVSVEAIIRFINTVKIVIGVCLLVLYIRVFCECIIVIFNIAASLKAIESNTRKR